jgi:hypothetical protein
MKVTVSRSRVRCKQEEIEDYAKVLDGLIYDIDHGGYVTGHRNNMIVNLVVCCYELDRDWRDVMNAFLQEFEDDEEDAWHRAEVAEGYADRFRWGYMLNPSIWRSISSTSSHMKYVDIVD